MKRIWFFFLLLLLPATLEAQSVGQVRCGSRIFSTGITEEAMNHWNGEPEDYPKMTKERREIALKCIERVFGKIESYKETCNECQSTHLVVVTLVSGDTLDIENGCLSTYTIVSPRFLIASDAFENGLRVGRKPDMKCKEGVIVEQTEKDPSSYRFYWEGTDYEFGHFTLDEKGRVQMIELWHNDC